MMSSAPTMQENILFDESLGDGSALAVHNVNPMEFAISMKSAMDQRIMSLESVVEELAEEVVCLRQRLKSLEGLGPCGVDVGNGTGSIDVQSMGGPGEQSTQVGGFRVGQESYDVGLKSGDESGASKEGREDDQDIAPWENPPKGRDGILPSDKDPEEHAALGKQELMPESEMKSLHGSSMVKNLTAMLQQLTSRVRGRWSLGLGRISAVVGVGCLITSILGMAKAQFGGYAMYRDCPPECGENRHDGLEALFEYGMCEWID